MTRRFRYDRTQSPSTPVLPVRVGTPTGRTDTVLAAIVDTGATITVIPERLALDLRLPVIGELMVRGVTGMRRASTYGAELEVAGITVLVEVVGIDTHTLIGRDVLNRWTLILRGPRETLELVTDTSLPAR